MSLNISEILIANGTGMVMVAFFLFFRLRKQQQLRQVHEQIFSMTLVFILVALIAETFSSLIDGRIFTGCFFLQYLSNTLCIALVVVVGFSWCLFVDYRIYCNTNRLKRKAAILGIPLLLIIVMLLGNLFGNGIIFAISPENRYIRGRLNIITYVVLFIYIVESVANALNARKKGVTPFFFPIYCFVVPCMVGTIFQGFFYGLSIGWLATSMATVFVYLELQTANYYVDGLSGLFNRQYMNYYLSQKAQRDSKLHGIMLDINDFKSINDVHGHTVGDRAIHTMGKILSQSIFRNAIAMRVGGDEFVIFLYNSSDEECQEQMESIQNQIEEFNKSGNELFNLSASMGRGHFDGRSVEKFLSEMDSAMYEMKREYHRCKQI